MSRQTVPRILTTIAILTMIASGIGFVVSLVIGGFSDDFKKFGEVSIPGSISLELPAGDVAVSFHTVLIGGSGNGLPVPPLKYRITAPAGVDEPQLTEDYGATTTVNNDARVRIGYLHVPAAATYDIEVDGNVSAYLNPALAFGPRSSGFGNLPLICGVIFGLAVVDLVVARLWAARVSRQPVFSQSPPAVDFRSTPGWSAGEYAPPTAGGYVPPPPPVSYQPAESFTPSDEGLRVQSLNTLARLRDSGALTQDEYDTEKKRVLDGP